MRAQPEHVLLFRSGRHLQVALDAIQRMWPGAIVTVVATPSGVAALGESGIPENRRIIFDRTPFFGPLPFLRSACFWRALATRPNHVAVLWNTPDGWGQSNVDHTAMLIAPGGFAAITPDGSLIMRRWMRLLACEARRAAASLAVGAAIGLLLYVPARAARLFR